MVVENRNKYRAKVQNMIPKISARSRVRNSNHEQRSAPQRNTQAYERPQPVQPSAAVFM